MDTNTPSDVALAYAEAIDALDAEALLALYADDAVILDAFAWRIPRAGWAAHVADWFGGMRRSNGTRTANLAIVGGPEVAGLSMDVRYSGLDHDGGDRSLWNRLTWVLRRTDAGWRIAQEQTSVPLRMTDMTPDLTHTPDLTNPKEQP